MRKAQPCCPPRTNSPPKPDSVVSATNGFNQTATHAVRRGASVEMSKTENPRWRQASRSARSAICDDDVRSPDISPSTLHPSSEPQPHLEPVTPGQEGQSAHWNHASNKTAQANQRRERKDWDSSVQDGGPEQSN